MRFLISLFVTMLWTLLAMPALATSITTYHIGNSLTWDSQPLGIAAIADDFGFDHTVGHHIKCARALNYIWDNPEDTCLDPVEEFGRFGQALPNHPWNAVTMQPHTAGGGASTLLSDETSILAFIDLALTNGANSDTTYYIYSAWPKITNFETDWTSSVVDVDTTTTTYAREYFDLLFNRVTAATSAKVAVIPVGEVLYELKQRIEAGQVPGFTDLGQLYRDDTHLTVDVGRYVAGITTFATMYGIDPAGSTKPTGFYGSDSAFSPQLYTAIHAAVWDVISATPSATPLFSPGDFSRDETIDAADLAIFESAFGISSGGDGDRDGDTDGADFLLWQRGFEGIDAVDLAIFESAFGISSGGDGDRDGDTDGADFLLWQRGFEGSVLPISSPTIAVPEPNTLVLLVLILIGAAGTRCCRIKKQSFRI